MTAYPRCAKAIGAVQCDGRVLDDNPQRLCPTHKREHDAVVRQRIMRKEANR